MRRALLTALALLAILAPVAAASPSDLSARTEAWMEGVLQVPIAPRPLVEADLTGCGGNESFFSCDALSWPDRIEVSPRAWIRIDLMESRGRDSSADGIRASPIGGSRRESLRR